MNEHEVFRFIDGFLSDIKRRCFGWMELKSGDRVLDVGCGLGLDVQRSQNLNGLRIDAIGVDLHFDRLRCSWEVVERQGGLFFAADAAMLPFSARTFDVMRADRLLQHVDSPVGALCEFKRVAKLGGRIVLADSDHASAKVLCNNELIGQRLMEFRASTIRNPSAGRMLRTWCQKAGLRLINEETIGLTIESFEFAKKVGFFFGAWDHKFCLVGENNKSEMRVFLEKIKQCDRLGAFRFKSEFNIALCSMCEN